LESLEYIENYFKGQPEPDETARFEQRIREDAAFAEEVAFYLGVMHVARTQAIEEKKQRFHAQYRHSQQEPHAMKPKPVKRLWTYAAVAALISGLLVGWFFFVKEPGHQRLADQYIEQNFRTLGVNLGNRQDSLRAALRLYNAGKLPEALKELEAIQQQGGTANVTAIKYKGIICLKLGDYDKALAYFSQLDSIPGLYSNPGRFYQALTLMKRNQPGDETLARQKLEQVVQDGLEGREVAREWLRDF
jgi:tetratricopeptide (TPR) repeat protein